MIDKQDEILAALLRIEKLLERKPVIVNNTFAGNPSTKAVQISPLMRCAR